MEVDEIAAYIKDMVDPDADIIWGSSVSAEYDGRIRVAIVATGIAGPAAPETAVPDLSALIAAPAPAAAPPRPVAIGKTEARLTLRRPLVLVPPETEVDIPMVDLFAPAAPPIRKPSLYERMATASQPPAGRRREPALLHSL
jgi:cell division protein FtsZ